MTTDTTSQHTQFSEQLCQMVVAALPKFQALDQQLQSAVLHAAVRAAVCEFASQFAEKSHDSWLNQLQGRGVTLEALRAGTVPDAVLKDVARALNVTAQPPR